MRRTILAFTAAVAIIVPVAAQAQTAVLTLGWGACLRHPGPRGGTFEAGLWQTNCPTVRWRFSQSQAAAVAALTGAAAGAAPTSQAEQDAITAALP